METPGFTTPGNTIGMGNPTVPTDITTGSGDTFQVKTEKRKHKKLKSLKDYLKNKKHD